MTVKNLKETLIGNELFEKIGFKMDDDWNYYVALNCGNIVTVESDGTTVQYNCGDDCDREFSNDEKENLLHDILAGYMDVEELEEKYKIDIDVFYNFGEWLSEDSAADF